MVDQAIILAGGLGTRLRPVVSDVPKPLAPVAGRPFVAWMLDHLAISGIRRVIMAVGHMAESIEEAVGHRWATMAVEYSVEERQLGTGGAVRNAAVLLDEGQGVHVVNGDTFLHYEPAALEWNTRDAGVAFGVALAQVPDVTRYGAVEVLGGKVAAFREKGGKGPGWINAGCYFLAASALRALPAKEQFSLERDVLCQNVGNGIAVLERTANFIDIGVPEDYLRAQTLFGTGA